MLLVGLGDKDEFNEAAYRDVIRSVANALKELGVRDAMLYLVGYKLPSRDVEWNVRHAMLGLRDACLLFDQLKTQKKSHAARARRNHARPARRARYPPPRSRALREAVATADGAALARTLGNLPSNICTPTYLPNEAKKLARQFKLRHEVLERRDMERLGMGALVSVTQGSHQPPKLIVLHYNGGPKSRKPVVLVGKGVTFDTGGISLKPGAEMDEMKFDMSGAASVLGAMRALAGMKAPVNVIGVVPAVENMPGGGASKPGDVVTTLSGQTVEILNTDAEGRLILCDALTYAERYAPDVIVDIATLTGACVIALGHVVSGLFANDARLADALVAAGDDAWDRVWHDAAVGGLPGAAALELRRHGEHRRAAGRQRDRGLLPGALHAQAALGASRHRRERRGRADARRDRPGARCRCWCASCCGTPAVAPA